MIWGIWSTGTGGITSVGTLTDLGTLAANTWYRLGSFTSSLRFDARRHKPMAHKLRRWLALRLRVLHTHAPFVFAAQFPRIFYFLCHSRRAWVACEGRKKGGRHFL